MYIRGNWSFFGKFQARARICCIMNFTRRAWTVLFFLLELRLLKLTFPLLYVYNWRAHFQNLINPLLMKIEFITSLYRITLELVTEWILDPDNSSKYFLFISQFCFPIDVCINSVKETCFSQKYQKWIDQVLEINSSIKVEVMTSGVDPFFGLGGGGGGAKVRKIAKFFGALRAQCRNIKLGAHLRAQRAAKMTIVYD